MLERVELWVSKYACQVDRSHPWNPKVPDIGSPQACGRDFRVRSRPLPHKLLGRAARRARRSYHLNTGSRSGHGDSARTLEAEKASTPPIQQQEQQAPGFNGNHE